MRLLFISIFCSLLTLWEARAQEQTIDLSGTWRFQIDREDEGSIILPAKTVSELEKLLTQGKNVKISL